MSALEKLQRLDRQIAEINAAIRLLRKGSNRRGGLEIRRAALVKERDGHEAK